MQNNSILGYKTDSPDKNNKYNIIPSNKITMEGVETALTLIPIKNGKPQYHLKRVAKPGDPDIEFDSDVTHVLEIPNNQVGGALGSGLYGYNSQNNFNIKTTTPNPYASTGLGFNSNFGTQPVVGNSPSTTSNEPLEALNNPNLNPTLYNLPNTTEFLKTGAVGYNKPSYLNTVEQNIPSAQPVISEVKAQEIGAQMKNDTTVAEYLAKQQVKSKAKEEEDGRFRGAPNPYGDWNMETAATAAGFYGHDIAKGGANFGNVLGLIGGIGKFALAGARNAYSGAAANNRFREAKDRYEKQLIVDQLNTGGYYQKGGEISDRQQGLLMTGSFLKGDDDHPEPNAEIEKGEYAQTPDGQVMEVMGKRHSEGGENVKLPAQTKIISDYLKIGSKLATYFKNEFNLNVKSGSTFATVIDKYKKKIGLDDVIEEEGLLIQKIVDQDDVKFDSTRELNISVLTSKLAEVQEQKAPLDQKLSEFTNLVYDKQEEQKVEEGYDDEFQEGGEIDPREQQMIEAIQAYASKNGVDPQEVVNHIQNLPDNEKESFLKTIMESSQAPQQEAAQGNEITPELQQLVMVYCQITGAEPNQIMTQLQKLPQGQFEQAIQQIIQVVEESQGETQQVEQAEPNSNPQEEQAEQQAFQEGGQLPKYQKAGEVVRVYDKGFSKTSTKIVKDPVKYEALLTPQEQSRLGDNSGQFYNPGSKAAADRFLENYENLSRFNPKAKPGYEKAKAELEKAKNDDERFKIINSYAQRDRQGSFREIVGDEALAYIGIGNAPTQTQIAKLVSGLKGKDRTEAIKLFNSNGWGIDPKTGSVNGGYYKNKSDYKPGDPIYDFMHGLETKNPTLYKEVGVANETDGAWDRRVQKLHTMAFVSTKERDDYFKEKGFVKKGNVYVDSNNRNNVIIPKVYRDKVVTEEEYKKYLENKNSDTEDVEYKNFGEEGVYDRYVTQKMVDEAPKQTTADPAKNPDPKDNINPMRKNKPYAPPLPLRLPSQENLPPILFTTTAREVRHVQADKLHVSPEANLKQIANNANTAQRVMVETNPYTSGTAMANLQAQTNDATNQAIMQTTLANQQDERNVDNTNESRIMQRDTQNLQLSKQYETEQITAMDNYYKDWQLEIERRNKVNLENWNTQNQVNAYNATNPNYQINSDGSITQSDQENWIYMADQGVLRNSRTGEVKTVEQVKEGNKTTTTTTTATPPYVPTMKIQKQSGGLIMRRSLLDLIKK